VNLRHVGPCDVQGLRTLVLGSRVVGEAEWAAWNTRYQAAAASLEGREEAIAAVAAEVERGLELVGVTAIEDKLQRGVPQAIKMLIAAGIKVWTRLSQWELSVCFARGIYDRTSHV
jgi:magnesium-transporting ATPase (P-type)